MSKIVVGTSPVLAVIAEESPKARVLEWTAGMRVVAASSLPYEVGIAVSFLATVVVAFHRAQALAPRVVACYISARALRTPGSTRELERVRMIAANLFERHVAAPQIARDLGVDDQTVRRWRRVWRDKGREGLCGKPHPGRPALLDDAQRSQLVEALHRSPVEHGFDRHFWTTPMIRGLIERLFGVSYVVSAVG